MLSDFLITRNLFYRGGGGGEGQSLPFSVFAFPGYTGVELDMDGIKMFKVSDELPAITENDCGCFVAFTDTTMVNTHVVLHGDEATLNMVPGMVGILTDLKSEIPVMMWVDDTMCADLGIPEPGTYVHQSVEFTYWALMWAPNKFEE